MIRQITTEVRLVTKELRGRANASADASGPYLVLDLGRGRDPHQARCRRCRWRSGWWATAAQVRAEHDRHELAAHGRGRHRARGCVRGLVARWAR
jgi:hypothetical protein